MLWTLRDCALAFTEAPARGGQIGVYETSLARKELAEAWRSVLPTRYATVWPLPRFSTYFMHHHVGDDDI
jgi:hypothetical protein